MHIGMEGGEGRKREPVVNTNRRGRVGATAVRKSLVSLGRGSFLWKEPQFWSLLLLKWTKLFYSSRSLTPRSPCYPFQVTHTIKTSHQA